MRTTTACVPFSLLMLTAVAAPAGAQGHVIELGLLSWRPSPVLTLSSDSLAAASISEVDFVQEFGIENESFPQFRAAIGGRHKFRLSHVKFSYDPEAIIQRTLTFQGRTFAVNTPASASIEWDLWTFGYEWDVVSGGAGFVGIVADLKYNRVRASIDSPALQSPAATDTTAPVPAIGLAGRVGSVVSVGGEFTGLKIGSGDFDVSFTDFDVNAAIVPSSRIGIGVQVGYRSVVADYVVDEDTGDLKMKGPYFGVIARF